MFVGALNIIVGQRLNFISNVQITIELIMAMTIKVKIMK